MPRFFRLFLKINRFLKYWSVQGKGKAFGGYVISYADDFVMLSRGHAARALDWTREVMERLRLDLNAAKTVIRDARKECFDFLGYTFGSIWFRKEGTRYMSARPSLRSIGRLREKVCQILRPSEGGDVAGGTGSAKCVVAGLVYVLSLRHDADAGSGRGAECV